MCRVEKQGTDDEGSSTGSNSEWNPATRLTAVDEPRWILSYILFMKLPMGGQRKVPTVCTSGCKPVSILVKDGAE